MLYFLRTKAKHFGFVLFGIIIVAFVFWVPGGFDRGNKNSGTLAKVGDIEISLLDFWTVMDNAEKRVRDQNDNALDDQERERLKLDVLAGLIHEAALLQAADEEEITVSNKEVADAIRSEQAFWKDGAFDVSTYQYVLRQNRMDRKYYEHARKRELIKDKILSLADTVVDLSPEEEQLVKEFAQSNKDANTSEIKAQLLAAKQNDARISFSEGIKEDYFTTYNLDLIKGR